MLPDYVDREVYRKGMTVDSLYAKLHVHKTTEYVYLRFLLQDVNNQFYAFILRISLNK